MYTDSIYTHIASVEYMYNIIHIMYILLHLIDIIYTQSGDIVNRDGYKNTAALQTEDTLSLLTMYIYCDCMNALFSTVCA